MTLLLVLVVVMLSAVLVGLGVHHRLTSTRRPAAAPPSGPPRILFPYMAGALSQRALDAALRLARAEAATLLPVFLASVPLTLPLDSPLPRQAAVCLPLQEAIEQRAAAFGVPVDSRVERGRTYRHALHRTIASERFERIVIAAARDGGAAGDGFHPDDVAWLLAHAPGEIVVLRPGAEDQLLPAHRARGVAASAGGAAPPCTGATRSRCEREAGRVEPQAEMLPQGRSRIEALDRTMTRARGCDLEVQPAETSGHTSRSSVMCDLTLQDRPTAGPSGCAAPPLTPESAPRCYAGSGAARR